MLRITQVRIYPFDTRTLGGRVLAYADLTLEGALLLKGFRVVEGKGGGLFVTSPAQRGRDGRYHELVVPLDAEMREYIRRTVIEAFQQWTQRETQTER